MLAFRRRQKGERQLLEAPRIWQLAGYEGQGALISSLPALTAATGPQVCQGNPIRTRPKFPGTGFSQFPQVSATSNTREDPTSRGLFQASSGLDGYMKNFPGLTQSSFHHDLGTKGGRLDRKGQGGEKLLRSNFMENSISFLTVLLGSPTS